MLEIVKAVCPLAEEAFENHILHSVTLSKREADFVKSKIDSLDDSELTEREKELLKDKLGL